MKTPMKFEQHKHGASEDNNLLEEHNSILRKRTRGTDVKKNLLLTPFLLSLPVIIILFSLISASTSEVPDVVSGEPRSREIVISRPSEPLNSVTEEADSSIRLKTTRLPSEK